MKLTHQLAFYCCLCSAYIIWKWCPWEPFWVHDSSKQSKYQIGQLHILMQRISVEFSSLILGSSQSNAHRQPLLSIPIGQLDRFTMWASKYHFSAHGLYIVLTFVPHSSAKEIRVVFKVLSFLIILTTALGGSLGLSIALSLRWTYWVAGIWTWVSHFWSSNPITMPYWLIQ